MKNDCGFTIDNDWFRYRAAAIIVENDCVLFVKNEVDDYYYSIGGAVHIGERAEDAVIREVFEETGVTYQIEKLAFIHENFFIGAGTLGGYKCHEIAFYFLMKPRGSQTLNSNSYNSEGIKEFMHWLPINELNQFKAFPTFFKDEIHKIDHSLNHIVTYEF
ncbi:MAG: NUDIX hydrolase [Cyclobacteriaceae bacterium]